MKIEVIKPFDIYVDPQATHLYPRWWHKLLFWRTYRYPSFAMKTKRMTLAELLSSETNNETPQSQKKSQKRDGNRSCKAVGLK